MKRTSITLGHAISRRRFLRRTGIMLSLPLLDAMLPAFAKAASDPSSAPDAKPRRMFAICNNLGLLPDQFFPQEMGHDYILSPYLEDLREHRQDFTVFSGVSHPDVDGGHPADNCFLTAAPHPGRGSFRNTISLDQFIAERIGHLTRFPSLNLGVNVQQGARSLAWTSSGVLIPCEEKASDVFGRLFIQGTEQETEAQVRRLELGQSILDAVADQAKARTCRRFLREGVSSTASIWGLIKNAIIPCPICSSRCSSEWGLAWTSLLPRRAPCAGWKWPEHLTEENEENQGLLVVAADVRRLKYPHVEYKPQASLRRLLQCRFSAGQLAKAVLNSLMFSSIRSFLEPCRRRRKETLIEGRKAQKGIEQSLLTSSPTENVERPQDGNCKRSRRQFICECGSALAFAAAGFPAIQAAAAESTNSKTLVGSNVYGWTQYAQRDKKKFDIEEVISALRDTGYDYLESFMDVGQPEANAHFAEQLRAKGLQPVSLYVGAGLHEPGKSKEVVDKILTAAKVCQQAGFRVISCNADPIGREKTEEELKNQAAALEDLGNGLNALGMKLGVHQHLPEMANHAREFHYNFQHTKPSVVGWCYDVHWVWKGGVMPLDALKQYGERVVTWHLRQSRNGIWWEDLDTGDVDYAAVAKYAADHQLPRRFSVELALEEGTKVTRSVIENHRRSREFVRRIFES